MDIRRTLATLCLAGGLTVTAGCSGKLGPVNNVQNAPIYQNQGPKDLQQVRDAIAAALTEKGWGIVDESQGWILARVDVSDHWAKIRITYDTQSYTILHFESSPGLLYDGAQIHRRYNNWIEYLDEIIQEQLHSEPDDDDDDDEGDEAEASDEETPVLPGADEAPEPDESWNEGDAPAEPAAAEDATEAAPPPS